MQRLSSPKHYKNCNITQVLTFSLFKQNIDTLRFNDIISYTSNFSTSELKFYWIRVISSTSIRGHSLSCLCLKQCYLFVVLLP